MELGDRLNRKIDPQIVGPAGLQLLEPPQSRRFPSRTSVICILLFANTAIVYLDRQVMALTVEKIIADFHLTQQGWGKAPATFRHSYGIVRLLRGFVVDAYGPELVFPSSGLWAVGSLLTGLATGVVTLGGCHLLLGISEAFSWPLALKITNTLLSPEERSLPNGIFSRAAIGALVAPILVTLITVYFIWRVAFAAAGALWVIVNLIYTRGSSAGLKGNPIAIQQVMPPIFHILRLRGF